MSACAETLPEWDLRDLYPAMDSPEYRRDLEDCVKEAREFENLYKGSLAKILAGGGDALAEAIKSFEDLNEKIGRVMTYSSLLHAADSIDPVRAKLYGDAQETATRASSHLLFFTLELNRIEDAAIDNAMGQSAELARYRPWLTDLRKDRPYQLEDRVEQLFHDKNMTGRAAWNRLFDETLAELSFLVRNEQLSLEQALNCLQERDRDLRREAGLAIGEVLAGKSRLFSLITNTLAKDKQISDEWRGFADIADLRHLANRVESEVVDALVTSVRGAFPRIAHRYYGMKAKWLGLDRMQYWDRNAPLPHSPQKKYDWAQARALVLDAYAAFSPRMAEIGQRFFDGGWIDAPIRKGERPGALAHPAVPSVHPYIMLNYQGRARDVMTLAHELGHGVHQVLAGEQGTLMSHTPLTLAETASVFGEMLVFRRLLEQAGSGVERHAMLAQKVEDMINTVVRQISFYLFEREVHGQRRQGELTADQLGDLWMAVQRESLGDAFEFDASYRVYWSYIPHFIHAPFYVYAYAFGDCLVNSLYAVYREKGSSFEPLYLDMLRAGGTKHHSQLLAPFALDARDPQFWRRGLDVIEGMIEELSQLEQVS